MVDVGPAATLFAPRDEVYFAGDIQRPGCNSEYCLVDERIAGHKPRSLSFAEAAAMPLTTITAYEALFERMRIPRGEGSRDKRLLVVGGAGGVGSIAIQLAKALTTTTIIASASRPESATWVRRMGADRVADHRRALGPQLAGLSVPQPDYILCTADTDPYFEALVDLVAPQGALCFIVTPKARVDLAPLHSKSAAVTWELMYTRSTAQAADMVEQHRLLEEVAVLIDAGRVRGTLQRRLSPLCARTLAQAHALIETGTTIGKIVLEGWD